MPQTGFSLTFPTVDVVGSTAKRCKMDTKNKLALLTSLTADELDERAQRGLVVLIPNIAYDHARNLPKLPGGWIAKYVGPVKVGAEGKIVQLPDHKWTQKLWRDGQYRTAMTLGLSSEHARIWLLSQVKVKHDEAVVVQLAKVMKSEDLISKYQQYEVNGGYNRFLRWQARTGVEDDLSPAQRRGMVQLMNELLENGKSLKEAKRKREAARKRELEAKVAADKAAAAKKGQKVKPTPKHPSLSPEEQEALRRRRRAKKQAKFDRWLARRREREAAQGIAPPVIPEEKLADAYGETQLDTMPMIDIVEPTDDELDAVQGNR